MTAIVESPGVDTAEILRVATKLNSELEKLDIFEHIAVVNILNQLTSHRGHKLDQRAAAKDKTLEEAEPSRIITPHLIKQ
jgi:hypothetical protein